MQLENLTSDDFGNHIEPYRRELQVHCYRLMGTLEDAEDMVQETFVRAWKRRHTLNNEAVLRAWLYKIATNICLDALKQQSRRQVPRTYGAVSSATSAIPPDIHDPIWLQPYPDALLPTNFDTPDAKISAQESITTAFIMVLHLLSPRQRAILLFRDVLDWKAREVADLLDTSVSSVKSALFRARRKLADNHHLLKDNSEIIDLDATMQDQLQAYVQAFETANVDDLLQLLTDDATFSMPPIPAWYQGHDEIRVLLSKTIFGGDANGRWQLIPTASNLQPAYGLYRLNTDDEVYEFYGIQVLTIRNHLIADILTFRYQGIHDYFHLSATMLA